MDNKIPQSQEPTSPVQVLKMIILIMILLGLVFVVFKLNSSHNSIQTNISNTPVKTLTQKTDVDPKQAPKNFPLDIPIEYGANIVQNFNSTSPDGQTQATRSFVTKLSLSDNYTIYKKFMTDNDWKISTAVDNPAFKLLLGTKNKNYLQITMDENSSSKVKTISINYVELPKQK